MQNQLRSPRDKKQTQEPSLCSIIFDTAYITETGGRTVNEDCVNYFIYEKNYAIWLLADGVGGEGFGDLASNLVVENFLNNFKQSPDLRFENINKIIKNTNENILKAQEKHLLAKNMKSTLVCLMSDFDSAAWCNVGDSRLYHFRDGKIIFQTEDHSAAQLSVLRGEITKEEIRFHEDRNKLLRAFGVKRKIKANVTENPVKLLQDDAFLLCSDGFWENISEHEMENCMIKAENSLQWLENMRKIFENEFSEHSDNFSAVCVRIT